uniref:Uncharacterized protein n=1 Tax=Salmo trutta TaxID=8032 RepID=A0A674EKL3_SALTR
LVSHLPYVCILIVFISYRCCIVEKEHPSKHFFGWCIPLFNIGNIMSIKHKGCLATHFCNTTSTSSILGVGYVVSQTCCSTNLCNGVGSVQLPLTVALGAALVAIWSTLA